MSNRAKLPEGIDNIRPHLVCRLIFSNYINLKLKKNTFFQETMDNVPLLVSLFTDCTPDTTTEMVIIMQVETFFNFLK